MRRESVIDFARSSFTWKHNPWKHDEHYKYAGGFVGEEGQVYHVRFNLEASCEISDHDSGKVTRLFAGSPCRSEYTIAKRNLFQIPSAEWRLVFSDKHVIPVARQPSSVSQDVSRSPLSDLFMDTQLKIRRFGEIRELANAKQIVNATFANDCMNARSSYVDVERNVTVTVEYPVNLINVNEADAEFQICTGPVILPDLATWDGDGVDRVFLAHVAITAFDHVEFILQREVEAIARDREWLDAARGRDRHELWDPASPPSSYPPARPKPTVYNETWALDATNVVLAAAND
jgi:hypothetical protein